MIRPAGPNFRHARRAALGYLGGTVALTTTPAPSPDNPNRVAVSGFAAAGIAVASEPMYFFDAALAQQYIDQYNATLAANPTSPNSPPPPQLTLVSVAPAPAPAPVPTPVPAPTSSTPAPAPTSSAPAPAPAPPSSQTGTTNGQTDVVGDPNGTFADQVIARLPDSLQPAAQQLYVAAGTVPVWGWGALLIVILFLLMDRRRGTRR
jgi:outer membrane biosynthesis protein TonB